MKHKLISQSGLGNAFAPARPSDTAVLAIINSYDAASGHRIKNTTQNTVIEGQIETLIQTSKAKFDALVVFVILDPSLAGFVGSQRVNYEARHIVYVPSIFTPEIERQLVLTIFEVQRSQKSFADSKAMVNEAISQTRTALNGLYLVGTQFSIENVQIDIQFAAKIKDLLSEISQQAKSIKTIFKKFDRVTISIDPEQKGLQACYNHLGIEFVFPIDFNFSSNHLKSMANIANQLTTQFDRLDSSKKHTHNNYLQKIPPGKINLVIDATVPNFTLSASAENGLLIRIPET